MAQFDPNMWYQITEARVGFGSGLTNFGQDETGFEAWNSSDQAQHWQILACLNEHNTYAFRNRNAGTGMALGTAYETDEVDPSHTQPRFMPINPDDNSQKWIFGNWSDNTQFISNVGNGSALHLDVHPGNPVFLSSQTSSEPYDPGQHWEFKTIEAIDDAGWSTTLSATATPITSSTQSTGSSTLSTVSTAPASDTGAAVASSSQPGASAAAVSSIPSAGVPASSSTAVAASNSGLSAGAAVGIGVGTAVAVMVILSIALFFLTRRRGNRVKRQEGQSTSENRASIFSQKQWVPVHEISAENERVELENTQSEYKLAELPASFYDQKNHT